MRKPKPDKMKVYTIRLDPETIVFLKKKGKEAAAWVRMAIFEARTK
jgi:hypothetical protein